MTASTFIFQLVPNLAVKVRSYRFAESANRHAVCVGEMRFTLMHSLTFLARGSAQLVAARSSWQSAERSATVPSSWQSITMKHCTVVKQWHLYEASLNEQKHLARDGKNNHKTAEWKTSASVNFSCLGGNVFRGILVVWVFSEGFFAVFPMFEVSVTFHLTSCFFEMGDVSHTVWTLRSLLLLNLFFFQDPSVACLTASLHPISQTSALSGLS